MSIALLNHLCGNTTGNFRKFINQFEGKTEPRIAWYPSAGKDFRALYYLQNAYATINPPIKKEPEPPNLFLFTDYYPWENDNFLDDKIIHSGYNGRIAVESIEELPHLNLPLYPELIDFPTGSTATNRVVFMNIEAYSYQMGMSSFPVLYCFSENTVFFCEVLLKLKAIISHIIHVRYGGGCGGGGTASGEWLLKTLRLLKTEVFITDNHYYNQRGDEFALKICPSLSEQSIPTLETIRTIEGFKWSDHGDVSWNLAQY